MKLAVIGLGSMGMGAALNLVKSQHHVTGCDLRPAMRAQLVAAGGHEAASPAELPDDLDALVLFVVNAAQVEEVLFGPRGCLGRLRPGTVILCCATVAPEAAQKLDQRLTEAGMHLLDAPVSGGQARAADGTMTVMAAGSAAAFTAAEPILGAIAGKVWRLGDKPGTGSTVKMVNQLLAGVHIAAAAEAMALGIRAGADPQTLYDVICSSAGNSWMWQNRIPHVLAGDDRPASAVNIFVKDLGIVLDQAHSLTFPLPMASAAHQLFLGAAANGQGLKDDIFVIRAWQALTGIPLPGEDGQGGEG